MTNEKSLLDNEYTPRSELEHFKLATGKHLVWTTMEANIGQRVRGVRTRKGQGRGPGGEEVKGGGG